MPMQPDMQFPDGEMGYEYENVGFGALGYHFVQQVGYAGQNDQPAEDYTWGPNETDYNDYIRGHLGGQFDGALDTKMLELSLDEEAPEDFEIFEDPHGEENL